MEVNDSLEMPNIPFNPNEDCEKAEVNNCITMPVKIKINLKEDLQLLYEYFERPRKGHCFVTW